MAPFSVSSLTGILIHGTPIAVNDVDIALTDRFAHFVPG
jgi:hypothetical protein